MKQYEKFGHMQPVYKNSYSTSKGVNYLSHQSVIKCNFISEKLRVVFDGWCRPPTDNSLNSVLSISQIPQPNNSTILIRFRTNLIAFTSDIQYTIDVFIVPED